MTKKAVKKLDTDERLNQLQMDVDRLHNKLNIIFSNLDLIYSTVSPFHQGLTKMMKVIHKFTQF